MYYAIENIAALIGARHVGRTPAQIDRLLTDSRSLSIPETTLFFAIRTKTGDGAAYIADLYNRGVRNFVVAEVPEELQAACPQANFLVVMNPLKALQRLAERHREEYEVPVVGVTGSNGKTVVKEWLYQLLSPTMRVTRSPRSYNSQIGVPLSVWQLNEQSQIGIFEAGISQSDEMAALRAIIQPTIGLLTNLGTAHQENFNSMKEKCMEKLGLFKDAKVIVYSADNATVKECVGEAALTGDHLAWSMRDERAALFIERIESAASKTVVGYRYHGQSANYELPFTDEASIENSISCLAICLYLGLAADDISRRMRRLEPVAMRLEVIEGIEGCMIINDSYNSDLLSLDIALDFLNRRAGELERRKVLVLSDIEQTGLSHSETYHQVAGLIRKRGVDAAYVVGMNERVARPLFEGIPTQFFGDAEACIEALQGAQLEGSVVLIKGARKYGFEKITAALSNSVHETTLNVDLDAIKANLDYYRSFLKPETKITCMIKASAYGAGAIEIARALQTSHVDYLAVAVADEGVALRQAHITAPIMIMNPEMTAFNTLFAYNLEPEVYSFKLLDALIAAAEKQGIQSFPIHLKLDTGMHRLGFNPKTDIPVLIDRLAHQSALTPRSVFSHFVGSDSPDFDSFSEGQFRLFDEASKTLQTAFGHKIIRHICNSAGIERFPERHLDMVRLGLGLYGIDPIDNRCLHNATSLMTTILQVREVPAGESVGYSRRTILDRPSRIAAIPIGYADGLNRRLGNRQGYCLVNGQKAPYVGNICMDVAMIDVTDIDCKEGDEVEIFGDKLPVTVISDILGTIPYEVLTAVSNRVKRIYLR